MGYSYEKERPWLFTEEGQVQLLQVRDHVFELLDEAGAVSSGRAISVVSGDTWKHMAILDRLVELGDIVEVTDPDKVWAQHRIFRAKRKEA